MANDSSSPSSPSAAEIATAALKIIEQIEALFPEYLKNPEDATISTGNLGVCIIDAEGHIYGRSLGPTTLRKRDLFRVAWTKASQSWITGMKTFEYERELFSRKIEASKHGGISNPDLIGWEGGQPITLKNGAKIFVGVSGMRGVNDLEIAVRAVAAAGY